MSISKCDTCQCQKVKNGGVLNPSDDIDDHDDEDNNVVAELIEYNDQIEVTLVLECKLFMSCNINMVINHSMAFQVCCSI